jgi:hypothetical protein
MKEWLDRELARPDDAASRLGLFAPPSKTERALAGFKQTQRSDNFSSYQRRDYLTSQRKNSRS